TTSALALWQGHLSDPGVIPDHNCTAAGSLLSDTTRSRRADWRRHQRGVQNMATQKGAEHHRKAAEHHELAAKHHREAAKHHEAGNHEKAAFHSEIAAGHGHHAVYHTEEAAKHLADDNTGKKEVAAA
ncbi:MAG: hypothetical protein WBD32_04290, partial [Acidobacteriaceae bacterium]